MHYTVKFTGTAADKEAQALQACKDYVSSPKRFRLILGAVKAICQQLDASRTQRLRQVYLALSFAGIQGRYPARALIRAAMR